MRIRFGRYVLDDEASALYRDGERVPIEPKPLALLFLLARERPRMVAFEEIQREIWPDVTVERAARDRVISQARHAIGDSGRHQHSVATRRARGLCFVADAETISAAEAAPHAARVPGIDERSPLFGRQDELARLDQELAALAAGAGGVISIEGEAGVGKTRLARELASRARALGHAVHWARCVPERGEAGPLSAWRQLLRSVLREGLPDAEPGGLEEVLSDLAPLLPELGTPARRVESDPLADTVQTRARWVDAIARFLAVAATRRPRVLVLDDLHWADRDSLRIALPMEPLLADLAVLIVVVWRGAAEGDPRELDSMRRRVARSQRCRLKLGGLSRPDIAALVEAAAGEAAPEPLIEEIAERSDGNAFFVTELTQLLVDRMRANGEGVDAQTLEVPETISCVLDERLAHLSDTCLELLRRAALLGREVDLQVLARSSRRDLEQVLAGVEEAAAAGVLREDGDAVDRVRFTHWLMADHLALAERSQARRARWHWELADALEELYRDRPERWAEIARHRARGLGEGDPETVVRAARRAADHAASALAYEDVASHLSDALRAQARMAEAPAQDRADLLLDLGRAQLRAAQREDAGRSFDLAATLARRYDLPEVLGRAALGFSGLPSTIAGDHKAQLDRVAEALGRLDERDVALRARLISRLASLRAATGDHAAAEGLAAQAVALAHSLDDPSTLASTLRARNAVLVGDVLRAEERIAHAAEGLAVADRLGDDSLALDAHLHRAAALLHQGDGPRFQNEMAIYAARAQQLRHPVALYYAEVALVTGDVLEGRLDRAEARAQSAHGLGRRAEHPDADLYFMIQMTQLRFFRGQLADGIPLLEQADARTGLLGMRAALYLSYAFSGREAEAARGLDVLAESFETSPRDSGWLSNLSLLSLTAVRVGDVGAAERLMRMLEPYANSTVTAFLVACNGSTAYFLGLLARLRGRRAEAAAYLELAREANAAAGCEPWRLMTELAQAELVAAGGAERHRTRALRIAREVSDAPASEQMPELLHTTQALTVRLEAGGRRVDPSED